MKASEIRVGNFILFPLTMDNGVIIPCVERKVDIIEIEKVISLNPPTEQCNFEARLGHCGGIELTEKWLINLGFINPKISDKINSQFFNKRDVSVKFIDKDNILLFFMGALIRDIHFVHDLQNLFYSLTETEL